MRLTTASLQKWRVATLEAQGGKCALCGLPIATAADPAVGDHNHDTGQMRGVLHRSCNSLLGNIENNRKRYGIRSDAQLSLMLRNVVQYTTLRRPDDTPLYPAYRTEDEKRELRNKRARVARAARKAT